MERYLVLVVADTLEAAAQTKWLVAEAMPGIGVLTTLSSEVARSAAAVQPDVVVTVTDSLEHFGDIHDAHAGVPIALLGSSTNAVANGAIAVFADVPSLAAELPRLMDAFRLAKAGQRRQVVLAIGAHPDDVEMGVGGVLAAHRAAGDSVTVLTLSVGHRPGGASVAKAEGAAAAAVIGANLISESSVELSDAIEPIIERVVDELHPTIVYTHSSSDRRSEHRLVHQATIAATLGVNTVACYHGTTGSTDFTPTEFVTIDDHIDTKLAMLACFAVADERPPYLEPGFVLSTSRYWSQYGLGVHVEPLEVVRKSAASPIARVSVSSSVG